MKGVLGDASCYADPQNVMYCLLYSACSASLLLINRLIMHQMPMASFVSSLQFAASMVTALLVMVQGGAAVDAFEWRKVKPYLLYVSMFVTTIYCNFRALEVSNVETLIVARSCVPFNVAILEFLCMGRAFPNLRSWFAMGLMVLGAAGYVASDKQFELDGWAAYTWVTAYFVVISFEASLRSSSSLGLPSSPVLGLPCSPSLGLPCSPVLGLPCSLSLASLLTLPWRSPLSSR